ncbi:glycosyltransferase family 4 protein [Citrobacter werkmanii]|uniref:glycosyltransferase family 4 protein n=1 Tax=Citrobacter werkmanii TaxID=67827 RepID=UPI00300CB2D9
MRVAMVLPSLERSGPGIHVEALSRALTEIGCYIEVFYLRNSEKKCLSFDSIKCSLFTLSLEKIKKLSSFDIIHTHGFFPDLYGVLLSRFFIRPVHVSTMHNFLEQDLSSRYYGWKKNIYIFLWTNVVKLVAHKIVFTNIAKKYYQGLVGGKVETVGSGIDVDLVLREISNQNSINPEVIETLTKLRKSKKIIGSTSIITEIKSLDLIIRALPELSDYAVVFVGGGALESDLISVAKELNVIDRCLFIGFVDNPLPYLSYFDVYAMPSKSESFGLSLFEAMAAKLPIICRDLPVFQELLSDVGLYKFDGSIHGFVNTVNNMEKTECGITTFAFEKLLAKYDMKKVAYNYYAFYQGVLNK